MRLSKICGRLFRRTLSIELGQPPAEEKGPTNGTQPGSNGVEKPDDESVNVSGWSLVLTLLSLFLYLGDLGMDMYLVYKFYQQDKTWYYALTLIFALVPGMVMSVMSLYWYQLDLDKEYLPPVSRTRQLCRGVCMVFLLAPIPRYCESFWYGWKNRKAANRKEKVVFFALMVYEDSAAASLRLFEAFMESGPQFVLHLYIYKADHTGDDDFYKRVGLGIGLAISLLSLAWSVASYHRSRHYFLTNYRNFTWSATALQFFGFLGVLAMRLIALALFGVVLPGLLVIMCGGHWLVMTCWIMWQMEGGCTNRCLNWILWNTSKGFMLIFCCTDLDDDIPTWKHGVSYVVYFLTNAGLLICWYVQLYEHRWYDTLLFVCAFLAFFIGVAFMVLYYHRLSTGKRMQEEEFMAKYGVTQCDMV